MNWRDYQTTTPDESQLEGWQDTLSPKLWGIVTNDRIAVIDADTPETRAQLEAEIGEPHVVTPRGGAHWYVDTAGHPMKTVAGLLPGVDVRGVGGFVNIAGGKYQIKRLPVPGDTLILWANLPKRILAALNGSKPAGRAKQGIPIPEADRKRGYGEYLASEHSAAILAWLVRGCVEWRQTGTLGEPQAVKQAVAEYRDQQDILHDYLLERCVFQKSATIDQKALYADYKKWAEDNDVYAIGKLTFRTRIQEKGASVAVGNRNIKIWRGIELRTDSDDDVTSVTSVADFSESLLREASTEKTLLKNGNKSNKDNTANSSELPDCPACGHNEWTYSPDGKLLCPCGHKQGGDH